MKIRIGGPEGLLQWLALAAVMLGFFAAVLVVQHFWRRRNSASLPVPERTLITEPAVDQHVRTPSDYLHLVVGSVVVLLGLAVATGASDAVVGVEGDLLWLFDLLPDGLARVLDLAVQGVLGLIPVFVGIVVLLGRRYCLFGMLVAAALGAQFLLVAFISLSAPHRGTATVLLGIEPPSWTTGRVHTGSEYLASLVATVVLSSPWISHRWRRAGWVTVAVVAVMRLATASPKPADVVLAVGAGVAAGSAVLLIFGAPDKRPRGKAVALAMARAGMPLAKLERAGIAARSSTPYFAEAEDGTRVFVKVQNRDERRAGLVSRAYRFARLKNAGGRGPFTSLQRVIEHEALVALYAGAAGIRTPRVLGTTAVGDDGFLLAYERIEGGRLDQAPEERITDEVLHGVWQDVADLRASRIAHRDLRLANVVPAPDGRPWLIGFGSAELAATDEMLDTDVAELLSSSALKVGSRRAVDAGIAVLGAQAVAAAAPRVQPLALSAATRKALRARASLCDELRASVAEATGIRCEEPQDLQRIRPRTIVMVVSLAVAFYLLIPQLADVSGVWESLKHADWMWALWALGAAVLAYVAAAIGFIGAVPRHLPFGATLAAQVAGSFVNRVVPARVGGMATNLRFLQKQGVDLAVATSSIGLQQVVGLVMHVTLSAVFLVWAGRSAEDALHALPSGQTVLIGLTVIGALSGLLFLLPQGRRLLRARVLPPLKRSLGGIADVARRPLKVFELFGGAALLTLMNIAALVLCLEAFGTPGVSASMVAVVYLVGSAVSSVAPTPGGIGAVEAALIAGLTTVGVQSEVAVPAVFMFRIVTFWLPILPGWAMLVLLQRRGDL